jgi:hypothetical protein
VKALAEIGFWVLMGLGLIGTFFGPQRSDRWLDATVGIVLLTLVAVFRARVGKHSTAVTVPAAAERTSWAAFYAAGWRWLADDDPSSAK